MYSRALIGAALAAVMFAIAFIPTMLTPNPKVASKASVSTTKYKYISQYTKKSKVIERKINKDLNVKTFIIDLPPNLSRHYGIVALYRGHAIPALIIPYPLTPIRVEKITKIIVDGKPLQELLREDPEKARRLLYEDKNVKVITTPVEVLVWEPNATKLLIILPNEKEASKGRKLTLKEELGLRLATIAIYKADGYEIRIVRPIEVLIGLIPPPFTPPIRSDNIFGYSCTMDGVTLDVTLTPESVLKLASNAKELKPYKIFRK